jgi:hypothetical protein
MIFVDLRITPFTRVLFSGVDFQVPCRIRAIEEKMASANGQDAEQICSVFDKVNEEMTKMALDDLPQDPVSAVPVK